MFTASEACLLDPFLHCITRRRPDLKLHRAMGLVLYHHSAGRNLVAMADVLDLETEKVAAAELAVD